MYCTTFSCLYPHFWLVTSRPSVSLLVRFVLNQGLYRLVIR